jgi:hypothetical protein
MNMNFSVTRFEPHSNAVVGLCFYICPVGFFSGIDELYLIYNVGNDENNGFKTGDYSDTDGGVILRLYGQHDESKDK